MVGLIAQWLERVNGKHEVEDSNPTWANFLYRIKSLSLKGISYVIIETDLYVKPTDSIYNLARATLSIVKRV